MTPAHVPFRHRLSRAGCFAMMICALAIPRVQAQTTYAPNILHDLRDGDTFTPTWLAIPYVFYTETFDLTLGVAGGGTGYGQEQMGLYGTVLGTANSTFAGYFLGTNIALAPNERLFLDTFMSAGYYTDNRDYVGISPEFPGERAGSNESDPDNYITDEGWDNWIDLKFKYVLPIGSGAESGIARCTLDRGMLVSAPAGGDSWHPLETGRTLVELEPFYRYRSIETETVDTGGSTSGLDLVLTYDNRDFSPNPTYGSALSLGIARDFGWLSSIDTWTTVKGSFSKYVDLGESNGFRQKVLALTAWTAYNPTWESEQTEEGVGISNWAPAYRGASLGGFYRMRAYPTNRYHDKAAVYYAAEMRVIPDWNPLRNLRYIEFLEIDWWQLVGIAELGRVAPSWDVGDLHSDMKWDVGIGLRAMMRKVVVRFDTAWASDSWGMTLMGGQPF